MEAQEIIDELNEEEKTREVYSKINSNTLKRYSEMGIEICIN
jgi:hypothetical protein